MADDKNPFASSGKYGASSVNYGASTPKQPKQSLSLADLGAHPNGQTFSQRKAKGLSEVAFWMSDEMKANLPKLAEAMGVKTVKEALQRALEDAFDRYV